MFIVTIELSVSEKELRRSREQKPLKFYHESRGYLCALRVRKLICIIYIYIYDVRDDSIVFGIAT